MILSITSFLENLLASLSNEHFIFAFLFLFLVIFIETGIVIFPFLPGDSILFLFGTLCSSKSLTLLFMLSFLLAFAAVLGDNLNYFIGKYIGKKIIQKRLIKEEYLAKTEGFFQKYGSKAIVLARFVPIIRTIIPFSAGIGRMNYSSFIFYNIVGGVLWVFLFVFAGYFFGSLPFVQSNLSLIIPLIIIISLLIPLIEYFSSKKKI